MQLTEVTVQNYRSIEAQTTFAVGGLTTLVGPNNEGKSNLLRALALGMRIIEEWGRERLQATRSGELTGMDALHLLRGRATRDASQVGYRWSEDYPLPKQERAGRHPTRIRLKFSLDDPEVSAFHDATGIKTNGELPIEISLGRTSVTFSIVKQGPGSAVHKAKATEIARFIADRISLISVPAVRTSQQALDLTNEIARLKMRDVVNSSEYRQLLKQLDRLVESTVNEISGGLTHAFKRYVPTLVNVELESASLLSRNTIHDIIIYDQVPTPLERKGDGIKSLVTLALIQELARERSDLHSFILAVDEPEAHLHANAVHDLHSLFETLTSGTEQVIVATHNPIFVNRESPKSNVLVRQNAAKSAKNVREIREALGVQLGDNLASAEIVVLVEGVTDEQILPKLLEGASPKVAEATRAGRIAFKALTGAGKARTQIQREKSTLCRILVVLDDDTAGRQEAAEIRS